MAKPAKPSKGRPPGRRGKGGKGPGPGYVPNPNTGGTKHKPGSGTSGDCCPMVAAVRSALKGKWKLAARYTRLSARLIAGRIA